MFSPESEAWLTHEDRERLEDWSWVLSISTRGERTFLGRGAVLGGLGPGSQGAGACLRLGGGVMHFRVELSMMAVTRVLIGVLLRYCGACRGLEPGLGPAIDSVREGLVKCAEARWEHAVVERDMPRPEILAPPPLTGDLERKHNQILFPFYRSVMFWRKVVFGTTNSQPSTLFGEIFKLSIYVPSSPDTEYSSLHFDISHSNSSLPCQEGGHASVHGSAHLRAAPAHSPQHAGARVKLGRGPEHGVVGDPVHLVQVLGRGPRAGHEGGLHESLSRPRPAPL